MCNTSGTNESHFMKRMRALAGGELGALPMPMREEAQEVIGEIDRLRAQLAAVTGAQTGITPQLLRSLRVSYNPHGGCTAWSSGACEVIDILLRVLGEDPKERPVRKEKEE